MATVSTSETDPAAPSGDALEALAGLLAAGDALVLSGAGMSTDSGIPDYRGPDGERRVTPMQYREFVASAAARQRYWARAYVGWQRFSSVRPNPAHDAVARLQRAGRIGAVITQNVDGLHQRAGSDEVVELHGSLADVVCLTCRDRSDRVALDRRMRDDNPGFVAADHEIRPDGDVALNDLEVASFVVPRCLVCGSDTLKPDVVFFGESVPRDRVERCFALTDEARSLLVLGSSLKVFSGYRFVRRAAERGIPVAIVTRGPTRGDGEATIRIDGGLADVLPPLADRLVV
ncbi:NAD-dependent protein deacetylase [Patulibacter defluvii]|uniref:NAD-dependent protein deacetylase n=1 Tax=Patulibacter defluvii TaxID=3095358 RepID=UPI002A760E4A|nr:NAD-dependent protein deacetylase [Patulibacter sp. DM4]